MKDIVFYSTAKTPSGTKKVVVKDAGRADSALIKDKDDKSKKLTYIAQYINRKTDNR